jgi:hypothetical protein
MISTLLRYGLAENGKAHLTTSLLGGISAADLRHDEMAPMSCTARRSPAAGKTRKS